MSFILIIFIVAAVVLLLQKHRKNIGSAWKEAADYLRLKFQGGGLFQRYWMNGRNSGFHIDVSTFSKGSGESSKTSTGYRLNWPKSLNLGLSLTRQGFVSEVASFLGRQDVIIGDPNFDSKVVVRGADAGRLREFFDRKRRGQVLRLMQRFNECEVNDRFIFCTKHGIESDSAALIRNVQTLVGVAKTLTVPTDETASTPIIPPPLPKRSPPKKTPVAGGDHKEEEEKADEPHEEEAAKPSDTVAEEAVKREPVSLPPREVPVPEPAPPPVVVAEPPPPVIRDDALSRAAFDLFDSGRNRYEIGRHFDTHLKDAEICGAGILLRISPYSNDRVFGRGPGVIAEVEICRPEEPLPGIMRIMALIQLPEETSVPELREHIGKEATICGTLARCDAFTGKLFLAEGELAF